MSRSQHAAARRAAGSGASVHVQLIEGLQWQPCGLTCSQNSLRGMWSLCLRQRAGLTIIQARAQASTGDYSSCDLQHQPESIIAWTKP